MCLPDQPALKVRLAASSKRDGNERAAHTRGIKKNTELSGVFRRTAARRASRITSRSFYGLKVLISCIVRGEN